MKVMQDDITGVDSPFKIPQANQEAPPTPAPQAQPTPSPSGMNVNAEAQAQGQTEGSAPPPVGEPLSQPQVVTDRKEKGKLPVFIIILIVIAVLVYGAVAYLYFSNKKLKQDLSTPTVSNQVQVMPEPTAMVETFQYLIDNGSIKKVSSSGTEEIIIQKTDYKDTGITGFINVISSSNGNYICFWSLPPALGPALYYSDANGAGVTLIAEKGKSCVWSNDEGMIAYINDATEDQPVDVYLFNTVTTDIKNLTLQNSGSSAVFRRYEPTAFSTDDSKILCTYEEIDTDDPSLENLGTCEIDIATGAVTDL